MNDSYAPWVKKLLVLKLFSAGSGPSWMDHELLIHRERKGQLVGSLDREAVSEMRTKWLDMAYPYLDNPNVSDADRKKLGKDIEAVKWAGICLDRLEEYDKDQEWRQQHAPELVEPPPVEPKQAAQQWDAFGARAEQVQGDELALKFAQPPPAEPTFEVGSEVFEPRAEERDQLTPVPPAHFAPPETQVESQPEPSTESLVDPAFIRTREQFIAACELANQRIREAEDIWDLKREIALSEMYEALAQTARMSKKSELLAKSVRFRAYFKAAHLQKRHQTNGQKDIFDRSEERFMHDLEKLAEEVFEKLLEDGVENGNLAEKLFRISGSKSTKATPRNRAEELDPRRFFLSFVCDMRANPTYYSPTAAGKLLDDPRILENLDPIEEHYVNFSIAIIGALRARRAKNVPQETNNP